MVDRKQLVRLKRDVEEWNQWRKENFEEVDLSGADLYQVNVRGANLSYADLRDANLRDANLTEANLTEADLSYADLKSSNLVKADLSNANLRRANLREAKLRKAKLYDAQLIEAELNQANLSSAQLIGANLSSADLSGANLSSANLSNATFIRADLIRANLISADLSNTNFGSANLNRADISNADLSSADLSSAHLRSVQAISTNFQNVTLTGACIQDWNINSETLFEHVICEYIYKKSELQRSKWDFRERHPQDSNKNFAPGDFVCWLQQTEEVRATANQAALEAQLQEMTIAHQHQQELIQFLYQYNTNLIEIVKILVSKSGSIKSMVEHRTINTKEYYEQSGQLGANQINQSEIQSGAKVAGVINEAEQQNLNQAAAEIQNLLEQLEKSYSTEKTGGETQLGTEAIMQINNNPTLKRKIMRSLKAGGIDAIENLLSHPAASFVISAIKEWQK